MSICLVYALSAANATKSLAQVQSGWASTFMTNLPIVYIWLFVSGLVLIVAFAAIFYLRRQKHHKGLHNWSTLVEPYNISAVLNRAADRNANFSLEVFHPDHVNIYKGQVQNLDEGRKIYLNLSEAPPPDLNFVNEAAQIHLIFRPSLKQPMEHYQFVSNVLSRDSLKEKGWRTTVLALNWPKSIIQSQRRNYLRLEPPLEKSVSCQIYSYIEGHLEKLDEPINSGRILDISIGGVQILFEGIFSCAPGQLFIVGMTLSIQGLDVPAVHEDIYLLVPLEILSADRIASPADHDKKMNTVVRTKFLGRFLKTEKGAWHRQSFKSMSFQDLAYWLQACYRLNLQKEHGLLPPAHFDRPSNRFPSAPPERPPLKYD